MHFPSVLVSAAALFTAVSAFNLFDRELDLEYDEETELRIRQIPHHRCSTGVHVIAASGYGEQNKGTYSLIGSLVNDIMRAIPDSTGVDLPYPKGSTNPVAATEVGSKNMRRYIREYHKACKKTKIVTIGYSAGAIITMNALCGASEAPWTTPARAFARFWNKHIIATIVYGDQTRQMGQEYNRGTCHGVGRFPRENVAACKPFAAGMRSYCDEQDPQCCLGPDPNSHFLYPQKYDKDATEWVVKRWRESKSHHTHHGKHHKKHHHRSGHKHHHKSHHHEPRTFEE